jgi:hypothetical protein
MAEQYMDKANPGQGTFRKDFAALGPTVTMRFEGRVAA